MQWLVELKKAACPACAVPISSPTAPKQPSAHPATPSARVPARQAPCLHLLSRAPVYPHAHQPPFPPSTPSRAPQHWVPGPTLGGLGPAAPVGLEQVLEKGVATSEYRRPVTAGHPTPVQCGHVLGGRIHGGATSWTGLCKAPPSAALWPWPDRGDPGLEAGPASGGLRGPGVEKQGGPAWRWTRGAEMGCGLGRVWGPGRLEGAGEAPQVPAWDLAALGDPGH